MPESTLTLCQIRLYPPSQGLWIWPLAPQLAPKKPRKNVDSKTSRKVLYRQKGFQQKGQERQDSGVSRVDWTLDRRNRHDPWKTRQPISKGRVDFIQFRQFSHIYWTAIYCTVYSCTAKHNADLMPWTGCSVQNPYKIIMHIQRLEHHLLSEVRSLIKERAL